MSEHISQGLTAKACFVNVNDSRGGVYVVCVYVVVGYFLHCHVLQVLIFPWRFHIKCCNVCNVVL